MMESDLDRLIMLRVMGQLITYAGVSVYAIFDAEFYAVNMGAFEAEGSQPAVICRTIDVASAKHGDTVVVGQINYTAVGIKPDGTGMTEIALELV